MYELIISEIASKSQFLVEHGASIAGLVVTVSAFFLRNWVKFGAVYKAAETAYHIVEEVAIQESLTTNEKTDLFEEKFRYLMSWTLWAVNPETLKAAHDLAKAFCDKYRSAEEKAAKKEVLKKGTEE